MNSSEQKRKPLALIVIVVGIIACLGVVTMLFGKYYLNWNTAPYLERLHCNMFSLTMGAISLLMTGICLGYRKEQLSKKANEQRIGSITYYCLCLATLVCIWIFGDKKILSIEPYSLAYIFAILGLIHTAIFLFKAQSGPEIE